MIGFEGAEEVEGELFAAVLRNIQIAGNFKQQAFYCFLIDNRLLLPDFQKGILCNVGRNLFVSTPVEDIFSDFPKVGIEQIPEFFFLHVCMIFTFLKIDERSRKRNVFSGIKKNRIWNERKREIAGTLVPKCGRGTGTTGRLVAFGLYDQ